VPRFAANLSMLFKELPLLERIDAAADVGFKAVEFQGPYEVDAAALGARVAARGLEVILLNAPHGVRDGDGDRGLGGMIGREADFWTTFERAMDYARALNARHVRVVSGFVRDEADRPRMLDTLVQNLTRAAPVAAASGVALTLEPMNPIDQPGYLLPNIPSILAVIDRVGRADVGLQFDFYHQQMTGGDLAGHATRLFGRYFHVQFSNAPGRHEPGAGEIDYPFLFAHLDALGYQGWVGCEYWPSADTLSSLAWAAPWGIGPNR
jgi:2-dehydrotetronate isomerase